MKFSSFFAFAGLVATAIAAPVISENAQVDAVVVKRTDITCTSDVKDVFQGLLVTVTSHTGAINATLDSQKGTAANDLVIIELKALCAAVTDVVTLLKAVKITLKYTVEEVQAIACLLFAIIAEILCTVLRIVSCLGIWELLKTVLCDLFTIICSLLQIVDGLISGVLSIVCNLLSSCGLLGAVEKVLGSVVSVLVTLVAKVVAGATGKILGGLLGGLSLGGKIHFRA
ncbi:hypothetical protein GQ53DRAFT_814923 [Thozetella sp. PMI_491]|nr:hypothetical protein GQ53DRAFT_814923 [Thozetella sp. PMI_491]